MTCHLVCLLHYQQQMVLFQHHHSGKLHVIAQAGSSVQLNVCEFSIALTFAMLMQVMHLDLTQR